MYDDEKTDLLKHWDDTYKYISKAKTEGSKVLVHCKMGISRSASVVIAYAMKAYNWDFKTALQHVREKRSCIKPNTSFLSQLETYQGILDAMKNKEKLQRSKSETNLKSPGLVAKNERVLIGAEPTPIIQLLAQNKKLQTIPGSGLRVFGSRPKSWSPDVGTASKLLPQSSSLPNCKSLENLTKKKKLSKPQLFKDFVAKDLPTGNFLMPRDNGESYSVSPNQIVHLPNQRESGPSSISSINERTNELEAQKLDDKTEMKQPDDLNVPSSRVDLPKSIEVKVDEGSYRPDVVSEENAVTVQTKPQPSAMRAVLVKKETRDHVESRLHCSDSSSNNGCDSQPRVGEDRTVMTPTAVFKTGCVPQNVAADDNETPEILSGGTCNENLLFPEVQVKSRTPKDDDPFSNRLDKVFDKEERKHHRSSVIPTSPPPDPSDTVNVDTSRGSPSRQNSWGSYDSAVGMGYPFEARDTPSRHSSWGSGDTRTLPSRNSSWGSYDMRPSATTVSYTNEKGETVPHPNYCDLLDSSSSGMFQYDKEDIPWYPGTVKRTKQKLEESSGKKQDGEPVAACKPEPAKVEEDITQAINTTLISTKYVCDESDRIVDAVNVNVKIPSAISAEINIVGSHNRPPVTSHLSVSAPESSSMELVSHECSLSRSASNVSTIEKAVKDSPSSNIISTSQCSSVKQHRTFLENLGRDVSGSYRKSFVMEDPTGNEWQSKNISGKVRNLKKEFEAKSRSDLHLGNADVSENPKKLGVTSLPSSPVSVHVEKIRPSPDATEQDSDDLNFKELVGKFEVSTKENSGKTQVTLRHKMPSARSFNKSSRHSSCEVSSEEKSKSVAPTPNKSGSTPAEKNVDGDFKRPPVSPNSNVVVATVIATAVKKQQQQFGKSHPLARLNFKPRHKSPIYNTM